MDQCLQVNRLSKRLGPDRGGNLCCERFFPFKKTKLVKCQVKISFLCADVDKSNILWVYKWGYSMSCSTASLTPYIPEVIFLLPSSFSFRCIHLSLTDNTQSSEYYTTERRGWAKSILTNILYLYIGSTYENVNKCKYSRAVCELIYMDAQGVFSV